MKKRQKTSNSKEPEPEATQKQEPAKPPLELNVQKDKKQSALLSKLAATQPSTGFQPSSVIKQPSRILERSTQLIQSLVKAVNMKDSKMSTGEFKPPAVYERIPIRKVQFRQELQPNITPAPKAQLLSANYLSKKLSEINKRVQQLSASVGISYEKSLVQNKVVLEKPNNADEKADKVVKKKSQKVVKKVDKKRKKSESFDEPSEDLFGSDEEIFEGSEEQFDRSMEELGKKTKNLKRPRQEPIQKKKLKKSKVKYEIDSMSQGMSGMSQNMGNLSESSSEDDYFMMKNSKPRKMMKMNQVKDEQSSEIMACRPKRPLLEPQKVQKPEKVSKSKAAKKEKLDDDSKKDKPEKPIKPRKPKKVDDTDKSEDPDKADKTDVEKLKKKNSKKQPKVKTEGEPQKPKQKRAPKVKKEPEKQMDDKQPKSEKKKEEPKPADTNFQSYLKNKLKNIEQQIQSTYKPPEIQTKPTSKPAPKPAILKESVAISNDDAFSHLKNKIDYFKQKQSSALRFSKIQPVQQQVPVFPSNSPLDFSSRRQKPQNKPQTMRSSLLDSRLKQILGNFRQSKMNRTPMKMTQRLSERQPTEEVRGLQNKVLHSMSQDGGDIQEMDFSRKSVNEPKKELKQFRQVKQQKQQKQLPTLKRQLQVADSMRTSKVTNRVQQILSKYQKIFKDDKIADSKKTEDKQMERHKSKQSLDTLDKQLPVAAPEPSVEPKGIQQTSPKDDKNQHKLNLLRRATEESPTTRDIGVGQSRTGQAMKNVNIVSKASSPSQLPVMRDTGLSQSKASEIFKNLQRKVYEESPKLSRLSRVISNSAALLPMRTDVGSVSTGLVNPEAPKPAADDPNFSMFKEKNYSNLVQLLSNQNFEVVIEQNNKDPTAQYPQLLVAASPKMKQNYQMYGDLVCFQLLGSSYQSIRLGLFVVFNSMRIGLLAGFTILFNASQVGYSRVIEYFFRIHGKEPQSILTSYNSDMISSLEFLQAENVFTGAHVIKAKDIIDLLEKEVKPWDGGSSLETICGYVTAKKKTDAEIHEKAIQKMCLLMPMSSMSKRNVSQILQKRQKICYSYLPRKFIGVGLQVSKTIQNVFQQSYRTYESFPKLLLRRVVEIDKMQKDDNTYQIYQDPVERIHDDPRLKEVRMTIQELVFRSFYKNYVQAILTLNVENGLLITLGTFQVKEKIVEQNVFEVTEWKCTCQYEAKTGLPCIHVLAGAIQTNKDYVGLIRKRWYCAKQRGIVRSTPNFAADSKEEAKRQQSRATSGFMIDFEDFDEDSDCDKPLEKYPQMILMI